MEPAHKKSFWALMVTQSFGAFNDNVFKVLTTLLIMQWVEDEILKASLVDLSLAVFVAPFLLFSMMAGRLADRISKPRVIIATKFWEVLVITVAILSMWAKSIPLMFIGLFLLSMQAAFFGPSKYGVLPELMGEDEISRGNGWINTGTFAAILLGTIVGSVFLSTHIVRASLVMFAASGLGLIASFFMNPLPAAKPNEPWAWDPLQDLVANWKLMRDDRVLKYSAIAVNYFWFVGAVFQTNIFLYAKEMLNASDRLAGGLACSLLVGIILGSLIAGQFSRHKVELGLVPIGMLGMSLFGIDLLWAYQSLWRLLVDLFLIGVSAGFYDIPLTATVQWRAPKGERGRVLATINFFSFVAILSASGVLWIMHALVQLNSAQVFFALGWISLAGTIFICYVFPEVRQRFLILVRLRKDPAVLAE